MERFGKRILLFVLALLLFAAAAIAEESEDAKEETPFVNPVYTDEFIAMQEKKLEMVSKLFPRTVVKNKHGKNGKKEEITEFEGFKFISRVNDQGQDEITIVGDSVATDESFNRGWGFYRKTGAHSDFYVNIEVQFVSQEENTEGWLWFQYSDLDVPGVGNDNRRAGEMIFPQKIDKYWTVPEEGRSYQTYYDLSSEYRYDNVKLVLEVIRLNGYTSWYIDHHFVAGFEDGFDGVFYPLYGVGLHAGGKEATFAFSDLIMLVPPKNNSACFTPDFSVSEH